MAADLLNSRHPSTRGTATIGFSQDPTPGFQQIAPGSTTLYLGNAEEVHLHHGRELDTI